MSDPRKVIGQHPADNRPRYPGYVKNLNVRHEEREKDADLKDFPAHSTKIREFEGLNNGIR